MAFLGKGRKASKKAVNSVDEIYVLKTIGIFKTPNEVRGGKKYATLYILVTKGKNAYYEFFSKNKIERESYMDLKEYGYSGFKIRDIEDIRPITEYSVKEFEKEQLIDFIMQLNGL